MSAALTRTIVVPRYFPKGDNLPDTDPFVAGGTGGNDIIPVNCDFPNPGTNGRCDLLAAPFQKSSPQRFAEAPPSPFQKSLPAKLKKPTPQKPKPPPREAAKRSAPPASPQPPAPPDPSLVARKNLERRILAASFHSESEKVVALTLLGFLEKLESLEKEGLDLILDRWGEDTLFAFLTNRSLLCECYEVPSENKKVKYKLDEGKNLVLRFLAAVAGCKE